MSEIRPIQPGKQGPVDAQPRISGWHAILHPIVYLTQAGGDIGQTVGERAAVAVQPLLERAQQVGTDVAAQAGAQLGAQVNLAVARAQAATNQLVADTTKQLEDASDRVLAKAKQATAEAVEESTEKFMTRVEKPFKDIFAWVGEHKVVVIVSAPIWALALTVIAPVVFAVAGVALTLTAVVFIPVAPFYYGYRALYPKKAPESAKSSSKQPVPSPAPSPGPSDAKIVQMPSEGKGGTIVELPAEEPKTPWAEQDSGVTLDDTKLTCAELCILLNQAVQGREDLQVKYTSALKKNTPPETLRATMNAIAKEDLKIAPEVMLHNAAQALRATELVEEVEEDDEGEDEFVDASEDFQFYAEESLYTIGGTQAIWSDVINLVAENAESAAGALPESVTQAVTALKNASTGEDADFALIQLRQAMEDEHMTEAKTVQQMLEAMTKSDED